MILSYHFMTSACGREMRNMKDKASAAAEESAEYIPAGVKKKFWLKAAAIGAVVLSLAVSASLVVPQFLTPNVVDEGFVTVSSPVPEDGSTPDMHTALENIAYMNAAFKAQNIAYMNAAFKAQKSWYSEMHGTTDASLMKQSVSTYKQFSDNVLIVADITQSSMVKAARQFCYTGDEVLWRLGSTYDASTFEEMLSAEWESGEPYAHMYLKDFIAENGLPATEFSVYIINEETLLSADEVIKNQDGTYSQTYYLDPAGDKAPAHYANQMVFSGGLTALPEFTSIQITYTFDDQWQVLESVVEESYKATMGLSVNCSSEFTTHYEYGTDRSNSPAYEEYFKQYVGGEVSGPGESVPTAVGCLGEAFGSVLSGPVVFDLSLTVNGTPLEGAVYLDIGEMTPDSIALRADFGILQLWLEEGEAYLQYGGIRGKLAVEELMGAVPLSEGDGIDVDALLAQLGEGEFSYDETGASLDAELTLGSLTLPVQFSFLLDENGHASLGDVSTQFEWDGLSLSLSLAYGEKAPAALTEADRQTYPDLMPHFKTLLSLFTAEALHAEVGYEGVLAGAPVAVSGALDVSLADGVVAGDLTLTLCGAERPLSFAYMDGYVFLNLDGIKLKANAEETLSFLGEYFDLSASEGEELSFELDPVLESVLSGELSSLVSLSEREGVLEVALKGNELLKLLGVDLGEFELGEVVVTSRDGVLTAEALGAKIALTQGERPSVDTQGYIDLLPYAESIADIFSTGYLRAEIDLETEALDISGTIRLGLDRFLVRAQLLLTTGSAGKIVTLEYSGEDIFLTIDEVRLRADADDILRLLGETLGLDAAQSAEDSDAMELIANLLSLDLGRVFPEISTEGGVLTAVLNGNRLLDALGFDFLTGYIDLTIGNGSLSLACEALHMELSLQKSEPFDIDRVNYIDVGPLLDKIFAALEEGAVYFRGDILIETGELRLPVSVLNGRLSWKNGFSAVVEGELALGAARHRFYLSADTERIDIAYGALGVTLAYDELPRLAEELERVLSRVGEAAEEIGIALPDALLQGMDGIALPDLSSFDLGELLSSVTMKGLTGGIFELVGEHFSVALAEERYEIATADIRYSDEEIYLGAHLGFDEDRGTISMPSVAYLGADDLSGLIEYLEAALNTVEEQTAVLTFEAGAVSGSAELYRGEAFPVRIDTEDKTVTIDTDCYLHLSLAVSAPDVPLYLEAWILDGDGDGMLDFYVTASRMREGEAGYEPLVVTASARELMPLLASAMPLLGIDGEIVNDYFVEHWLLPETAAQLHAIGDSLLQTLDIFGVFDSLVSGGGAGSLSDELIAAVVKGEDAFSVTLGGGALGMESDLKLTLAKTADEDGSPLLKAVGLEIGGTDIALELTYSDVVPFVPVLSEGKKYELDGMAELFTALAKTATHKDGDGYALNRTYLMSGEASLMLGSFGFSVKVDALAVSILENGDVALDARISYNDFLGITASQVDLSIRGSMIYMMRTSGSEVLYRAMPLSVFGATLKDQLVFLLHMSNLLAWMIPDDIGGGMSDEGGDLGAQAANILSSYDFIKAGSEDSVTTDQWLLTLNGEAITGGVLSDIGVTLKEGNGLISSLNVTSSLIDILTLSADLTLKNGGESWATEIDYNKTLSDYLANGMDAAIENNKANGWSTYLEGTSATITLEYNGETKTQDVLVNGETVLTKIDFPELEEKEGHTLKWVQSGLTFKPEYTPNIYHVQFTTEDALADGFETEYELAYGSKIEYYANGALRGEETVGAADMTLEMPGLTGRSVWYKAEANGDVLRLYAYENYDTVTFDDGFGGTSTENFVSELSLPTPTKEGYTFLGWWKETDNGWEKADSLAYSGGADVTLHALWAEDLTVDVACSRTFKLFQPCTYTAEGNVDGGHLAGSLTENDFFGKAELSVAVSYRVDSGLVGKTFSGECDENGNFKVTGKTSLYLNWTVTATATLNIGGHTFTMTGTEKGSF